MIRYDVWPPPEHWTEVRVSWEWVMEKKSRNPNTIFNWICEQPGGRFHLHGYGQQEGFSYRFEDPKDATWIRMNLPE
jgi:hypothetical protein